jgi:hypothetical protein
MNNVKSMFVVSVLVMVTILALNSIAIGAYDFNDGGSHTVDGTLPESPFPSGFNVTNNTHVNVVAGGISQFTVNVFDTSSLTMTGGLVQTSINGNDDSVINLIDGNVTGSFVARENAIMNMSGGTIGFNLYAQGSSSLTYSGGSVGSDVRAYEDGQLYLDGTGFTAYSSAYPGGVALSNGDELFSYGVFVDNSGIANDYYGGTVTGTMADSTVINLNFKINRFGLYDDGSPIANIVITPEPMTLTLLAVGGLAVMRRRRK